jgi:hypothetical protein
MGEWYKQVVFVFRFAVQISANGLVILVEILK